MYTMHATHKTGHKMHMFAIWYAYDTWTVNQLKQECIPVGSVYQPLVDRTLESASPRGFSNVSVKGVVVSPLRGGVLHPEGVGFLSGGILKTGGGGFCFWGGWWFSHPVVWGHFIDHGGRGVWHPSMHWGTTPSPTPCPKYTQANYITLATTSKRPVNIPITDTNGFQLPVLLEMLGNSLLVIGTKLPRGQQVLHSEVNFSSPCVQAHRSRPERGFILAWKPYAEVTRSSKQVNQWPGKGLLSSKLFFENKRERQYHTECNKQADQHENCDPALPVSQDLARLGWWVACHHI